MDTDYVINTRRPGYPRSRLVDVRDLAEAARDAMKRLVEVCCGELTEVRDALAVDGSTSVLLVSTEGPTDQDAYRTVGAGGAGRKRTQ